jgi:hypothetical protein
MSRVWFVLWAIVLLQIGAWAFTPEPEPAPPPPSDGPGFGVNENIFVEGRPGTRKTALSALESPWNSRCAGDGRKQFIEGLGYYYYQRQNDLEHYPKYYGKPGADYIAKQWSTSDDLRIDRLTQEAYARGYLKPSDFDGLAGKLVTAVVKNERVTGNACAG